MERKTYENNHCFYVIFVALPVHAVLIFDFEPGSLASCCTVIRSCKALISITFLRWLKRRAEKTVSAIARSF